jgi:deoxyribonuclease-1
MQADMYNLYPAIGEVNGRRSNYSMAIIKGEKREFGKCDVEIKNKKVEPKESIRGEITRTYLGPLFLCTKKVLQGSTS